MPFIILETVIKLIAKVYYTLLIQFTIYKPNPLSFKKGTSKICQQMLVRL